MDIKLDIIEVENYIKDYRITLAAFLQFISVFEDEIKSKNVLSEMSIKLEFYFNEMELKLLTAVKYIIINDMEQLFDSDIYAFFLAETFFIKFCKNTFDIKSVDPFTSKFADEVFPLAKDILEKLNPKEYKVLFGKEIRSLSFFHAESARTFLSVIEGAQQGGSCFRFAAVKSEADACLALIKPLFSTQENFYKTFLSLSESLDFRLKRRDYLTQQIALLEQKQLDELDKSASLFLEDIDYSFLANELSNLIEDKNISKEESDILKAEQFKIECANPVLLLGPSEGVLLLTGSDVLDDKEISDMLRSCKS